MNDITIIALVGVIEFISITLAIIFGVVIYKLEILRLKSNSNIKTNLLNGEIEAELSVDIEGKKAKEKDGEVYHTNPFQLLF